MVVQVYSVPWMSAEFLVSGHHSTVQGQYIFSRYASDRLRPLILIRVFAEISGLERVVHPGHESVCSKHLVLVEHRMVIQKFLYIRQNPRVSGVLRLGSA